MNYSLLEELVDYANSITYSVTDEEFWLNTIAIIQKSKEPDINKALDILTNDMHIKSKRPCSTCSLISEARGKLFGCSTINGYRMK